MDQREIKFSLPLMGSLFVAVHYDTVRANIGLKPT